MQDADIAWSVWERSCQVSAGSEEVRQKRLLTGNESGSP